MLRPVELNSGCLAVALESDMGEKLSFVGVETGPESRESSEPVPLPLEVVYEHGQRTVAGKAVRLMTRRAIMV